MKDIKSIFNKISSYIIVIFITVYVHDLIVSTSSNTTFINNFNFASTITSIILSVVAIIYTLIDSAQSKAIQSKIVDSSNDIQKSVKELREVSSKMKDIDRRISQVDEKINQLESNIISGTSEALLAVTKELNHNKVEIDNSKPINDELKKIISNLSLVSLRNCLIFYKAFKNDVELDIVDFNIYYNKILKRCSFPLEDIENEILITLDFLSSLGLIQYIPDSDKIRITDFNEELEQELMVHVPEEEMYADSSDGRLFGTVYAYFNEK